MQNDHLKLLNIDQACERLSLGRWSVYKLINQNRLKTVKIGKRRLVTMNAIDDFIKTLQEGEVHET